MSIIFTLYLTKQIIFAIIYEKGVDVTVDRNFGEILRDLRLGANASQDDLAKYLGIKRQTYGAYERGVSMPDLTSLKKIALRFNVSADYLLGLSEYQTAENDVISKTIPLSDEALNFIKSCPSFLRPTLDKFLSDPNIEDFLLELMTYVYSLGNTETSEAADLLAAQIIESGSSKTTFEVARILACRLTPLLQQTRLINALNNVAVSLNKRNGGFDGSMLK